MKKPLCNCKNFRLKKIYIIVTTKSTWIIRLFAAGQLEALKLALKTPIRSSIFVCPFAAGEVSKEGVFSSLYFPAFKLNTKICGVNSVFSTSIEKYRSEITLYLDTFHAVLNA